MAVDAPPRVAPHSPLRLQQSEPEPPLVFRKMSFDEYLRLPEKPKAEWLDGVAVIHMAPPQLPHFTVVSRLLTTLANALPDLLVGPEGPMHIGNRMLVPDIVAIVPPPKNAKWIENPPRIAVEVLSPSTRKYDLTTKLAAYLEAGVGQYWTVDTDRGEIVVRINNGKTWQELAKLEATHPTITIDVPPHGKVSLDRNQLFA